MKHNIAYIGFGSNIDPENHIDETFAFLKSLDPHYQLSSLYETEAVGFDGRAFINFVVRLHSTNKREELQKQLKSFEQRYEQYYRLQHQLELEAVSTITGPRDRILDLDLLLFMPHDSQITNHGLYEKGYKQECSIFMRAQIKQQLFVLQPLCELSPNLVLSVSPSSKQSVHELTAEVVQKAGYLYYKIIRLDRYLW